MKRVLLDTNWYVAFKRNDVASVDLLRRAEAIVVSTVVLGELLAGFRCGDRERQNRAELDLFLDSPRVSVVPVDEETTEFYAQIFAELKKGGRPIPTNDLWLAATALRHGLVLASHDRHFQGITGLLLAPAN